METKGLKEMLKGHLKIKMKITDEGSFGVPINCLNVEIMWDKELIAKDMVCLK